MGEALKWNGLTHDAGRLEFFKSLVQARWNELHDAVRSDPIKVFVKQEPHKLSKLREGRFRLISAVSVVDTMVDRILFQHWHDQILNRVGEAPALYGWTPIGGGYRLLQRKFAGKRTLCLDKSSWDWTVDEKMIALWLQFTLDMAVNAPSWWRHLVQQRFRALYRDALFRFSDGVMVRQPGWGVQKSGCYLTLLLNSVGQSFCHYMAAIELGLPPYYCEPIIIGDDTIQENFPEASEYAACINRMGYKVKEFNVLDYIEFAGHIIKDGICWPSYWQKHCYALQRLDDQVAPAALDSYQRLYAFEPLLLAVIHDNLGSYAPDRVISAWQLQREFDGI